MVTFASSTGRQVSQEDDSWGNGAFTKALGLELDARRQSGRIGDERLAVAAVARHHALAGNVPDGVLGEEPDQPDHESDRAQDPEHGPGDGAAATGQERAQSSAQTSQASEAAMQR